MSVYRIRELLTKPGKRKSGLSIEASVDTFTADDIHLVDQHSLQQEDGVSGHRFYAGEQLSVRDFLRNRPSLKRNQSVPDDVIVQLRYPPGDRLCTNEEKKERIKKSSSYGSLPTSAVGDGEDLLHSQVSNNNGPDLGRDLEIEGSSSRHSPPNNSNSSHHIVVDVEQEALCSQSGNNFLDKTNGTLEYEYQESSGSEDVPNSGGQEGEYEDGVMTATNREDVTITDEDEGGMDGYSDENVKENAATFYTPDGSTREPSPLHSQYYSPVSSIDNVSTYSNENETDLCMSVPTLTLASNSRLKNVGSSKAYSSSFQNLANVTVADNFSEEKRESDHNHSNFHTDMNSLFGQGSMESERLDSQKEISLH